MFPVDDTIVAIATAPLGAERGVIRVSGPQAVRCVASCFSTLSGEWQSSATPQVIRGSLRLDAAHHMPCELYLWPTRRSYTRQPVAELHTIGSRPLLERMVVNLCEAGARLANPGEFTLRAFLAGRLDLPQVEAVLGVIDSDSDQQFKVALGQLAGGLSQRLDRLQGDLLDLAADLEAGLDFVEEELEFISGDEIVARLRGARNVVHEIRQQMDQRTTDVSVPTVALVGHPNVGKSSLINALCDNDVAIVSPRAGTTRDYVSQTISMLGMTCELIDTAGLELGPAHSPHASAQEMASRLSGEAHFRLICIDGSRPIQPDECDWINRRHAGRDVVVATKCDLAVFQAIPESDIQTSVRTGQGIDDLKKQLARRIEQDTQFVGDTVSSTAIRCRDSLRRCGDSLKRAEDLARCRRGEELVAVEIRLALDQLGQVVGTVYTEDVLDRVFTRFCIGK